MSRFITIALLLLIFFFGGMSYGSFEKEKHTVRPKVEISEEMQTEMVYVDDKIGDETPIPLEEEDYIVHKTASFIEKGVTLLYEMIIRVLYGIDNLFFD